MFKYVFGYQYFRPSHQDFEQNSNSARLIYKSLFKMFIENEVNLHTFEFDGYYYNENDIALELILQNSNFVHNIRNLKLDFNFRETIVTLLKFLNSNCNSIRV